MRKWLRSIRGEHVAITGRVWLPRHEVQRLVWRARGIPTPRGDVTAATTVLVRGDSSRWAFGEFGSKEKEAARLLSKGAAVSLVYDSKFRSLLENGKRVRVADRIAGEPVQWLAAATKPQFERVALKEGPLDREHTALGRVEQSYLRHVLFDRAEQATCSLCGRRLPIALLVAAHVKPWSECSQSERFDVKNIVFGLCLLGCDALYERGLVSVGEVGRIIISAAQSSRAVNAELRSLEVCKHWHWHCGIAPESARIGSRRCPAGSSAYT